MFTTSVETRNANGHWAAIVGVLAICALLWAIGVVVQGQVQRAHARLAQPAQVQAAVSTDEDLKPVPVAYR